MVEQNGKEYTFTKTIDLDVLNADALVYIGIDASHYNEYVAGNYKDSMGNFGNLAAKYSVRTVQLNSSEGAYCRLQQSQVQGSDPHRSQPPSGGRSGRPQDVQC